MNATMQTTPDMAGSVTATAIAVWLLIMVVVVPIVLTQWRRTRRAYRDVTSRLP